MTRSPKDLRDLAGLYALDALEPVERDEFERFLATSPETQAEVEEFRRTATALAGAEAAPPPAHLRQQVLEATATVRQERPRVVALTRRGVSAMTVAVAAALVVIAGVALVLTGRLGEANDQLAVLEASDAVWVALDGEATPNLRVVWSASRGEAAVVPGATPTLPEGVYALWNLRTGGDPQAVAFFDGSETVYIDTAALFREPEQLAITIEPSADVVAPTGPIVAGPARA